MKIKFTKKQIQDTLYVTIGSFILAVSINSILLPNKIVAGGANGISVVINYLFGTNPALVLYAINLPLLVLCFLLLGKEVGIKTIYGSLIYPFFVGITTHLPVLTHNIFLATIFGGILTGIGLGLEFRGNASTGGTAIISQVVNKYFKVSLGVSILFVDGLVILSALFVFNTDTVLFSLICLYLIGRVVDLVQVGFVRSKNVLIISPKFAEIKEKILVDMDKGLTMIPIEGGYQKNPSMLMMTVISEKDFAKIKENVLAIDEEAFIVSMNASEVFGKGFSLKKIAEDYGIEANNL
ncbi:YitT family protein [Candidatus Enterococcus ikei]|uniref:YitT family protein n=1 Tax=Candidatus Enterococcus ikei TaxID=2815326 RepID=A0ABS3H0Y3_9ENTE|nr:YitT family protein [Enterococcus sp. DIV0869a]MBO0441182.1 YitT family protein [Enterococcus sp. DIV0869a]